MTKLKFMIVFAAAAASFVVVPALAQTATNSDARVQGEWYVTMSRIEASPDSDNYGSNLDGVTLAWTFEPTCPTGPCDVRAPQGPQGLSTEEQLFVRAGSTYHFKHYETSTGGENDSCRDQKVLSQDAVFDVTASEEREGQLVATAVKGTQTERALVFDGTGATCETTNKVRAVYSFVGARGDLGPSVGPVIPAPFPRVDDNRASLANARRTMPNRSVFALTTRSAGDVSMRAADLARSAILTVVLLVLVVFPSVLFNSTLRANYAEITGWFGFLRRRRERAPRATGAGEPDTRAWSRGWIAFAWFLAVSALLYGLLDPGFTFDRSSAVTFVGTVAAMTAVTLLSSYVTRLYMKRRYRDAGYIRVFPATLIVAIVCVGVSRLADFQPGYLYGLAAGFAFTAQTTDEDDAKTTAYGSAWCLVLALVAWLAWQPVRTAAAQPGAGVAIGILEAVLVAIFVAGFGGIVLSMIPLRYLPGESVFAWSKLRWSALFLISAFTWIHVILNPNRGPGAEPSSAPQATVLALFGAFGVISVLLWAYFRFRAPRDAPIDAAMAGSEDL